MTSKKSTEIEIRIWQGNKGIHIAIYPRIVGITGISTITDKDNSKRCHKHLYNQLKEILISENRWVE